MSKLELFLQGGLGNQLIQGAFGSGMVAGSGANLTINTVLLRPHISWLRRVTYRDLCPFFISEQYRTLKNNSCRLISSHRGLVNGFRSHQRITDQQSDRVIMDRLACLRPTGYMPMLGYFHRASAFCHQTDSFWSAVANWLQAKYHFTMKPMCRVATHIRLGDYTTASNKQIYAGAAISAQIETALRWRDELGGAEAIDIFTDDPEMLSGALPGYLRPQCQIRSNCSELLDFADLCSYQSIVACNSTYSLTAAKIASVLSENPSTVKLPHRWFNNEQRNQIQCMEWAGLSFLHGFWGGPPGSFG